MPLSPVTAPAPSAGEPSAAPSPEARPVSRFDGALALQRAVGNRAFGQLLSVQAAANAGTRDAGGPLPHAAAIQRSFGAHDVSGIRAHRGRDATEAARAMGAEAFATGQHVAFGRTPDLHTAAHEAAHVIQQRAGVQLKGGVGEAGDPYERQADAVADLVVQGRSAEPILDQYSNLSAAPRAQVVQRKVGVEYETTWKVTGDARTQHKKPIYKQPGWRIESDANNLEFVVEPPVESPESLRTQVKQMSEKAESIVANLADADSGPVPEVVGPGAEAGFRNQSIEKDARDPEMTAKAQFSFGVTLKNITGLLDKLSQGDFPDATNPEGEQTFAFKRRDERSTTRDYLETTVGAQLQESTLYRTKLTTLANGRSMPLQGFLSYLGYYLKATESTYHNTPEYRAAFLGQEILKQMDDGLTVLEVATGLGYGANIVSELHYQANLDTDITEDNTATTDVSGGDRDKIRDYVARTTENFDYPKYRFTLMNRSGFDRVFQSLKKTDRDWLKAHVDDVVAQLDRGGDAGLFASPYTYKKELPPLPQPRQKKRGKGGKGGKRKARAPAEKRYEKGLSAGPTIKEWLESIFDSTPDGPRDKISPPEEFIAPDGTPDPAQSLGALNFVDKRRTSEAEVVQGVAEDKRKTYTVVRNPPAPKRRPAQVVIELRQWGDYIPPADWPNHSFDMAFLLNLLAPGELNSDYEDQYAALMQKIADLEFANNRNLGGFSPKWLRQQRLEEITGIRRQITALKKVYGK
jgi:hypothetical protein